MLAWCLPLILLMPSGFLLVYYSSNHYLQTPPESSHTLHLALILLVDSCNDKSHNWRKYVSKEDSNQPLHVSSLIKVFIVRMKKLCILDCPKCAQGRVQMCRLIWIFAGHICPKITSEIEANNKKMQEIKDAGVTIWHDEVWKLFLIIMLLIRINNRFYFIASSEINVYPIWIKMIFSKVKEYDIFTSEK